MNFVLQLLVLSSKFLTETAGRTVLELIGKTVAFQRRISGKYEDMFRPVQPYDDMLEMLNANCADRVFVECFADEPTSNEFDQKATAVERKRADLAETRRQQNLSIGVEGLREKNLRDNELLIGSPETVTKSQDRKSAEIDAPGRVSSSLSIEETFRKDLRAVYLWRNHVDWLMRRASQSSGGVSKILHELRNREEEETLAQPVRRWEDEHLRNNERIVENLKEEIDGTIAVLNGNEEHFRAFEERLRSKLTKIKREGEEDAIIKPEERPPASDSQYYDYEELDFDDDEVEPKFEMAPYSYAISNFDQLHRRLVENGTYNLAEQDHPDLTAVDDDTYEIEEDEFSPDASTRKGRGEDFFPLVHTPSPHLTSGREVFSFGKATPFDLKGVSENAAARLQRGPWSSFCKSNDIARPVMFDVDAQLSPIYSWYSHARCLMLQGSQHLYYGGGMNNEARFYDDGDGEEGMVIAEKASRQENEESPSSLTKTFQAVDLGVFSCHPVNGEKESTTESLLGSNDWDKSGTTTTRRSSFLTKPDEEIAWKNLVDANVQALPILSPHDHMRYLMGLHSPRHPFCRDEEDGNATATTGFLEGATTPDHETIKAEVESAAALLSANQKHFETFEAKLRRRLIRAGLKDALNGPSDFQSEDCVPHDDDDSRNANWSSPLAARRFFWLLETRARKDAAAVLKENLRAFHKLERDVTQLLIQRGLNAERRDFDEEEALSNC